MNKIKSYAFVQLLLLAGFSMQGLAQVCSVDLWGANLCYYFNSGTSRQALNGSASDLRQQEVASSTTGTSQGITYNYTWLKGFHVDAAPGFVMKCNEAHRMGKGFYFNGNNSLSGSTTGSFIGNQMDDNYHQLQIDAPSGTIGVQGSSTVSNGNVWTWNTSNNSSYAHDETWFSNGANGNSTTGGNSQFFTIPNSSSSYRPTPVNNIATYSNGVINPLKTMTPFQISPSATNYDCSNSGDLNFTPIHRGNIDNVINSAYFNVGNFSMYNEANWNEQRTLYNFLHDVSNAPSQLTLPSFLSTTQSQQLQSLHTLKKNYVTALLNYQDIQSWYNNAAQTNMGKFKQVEEYIKSGNYQSAQTLNNSINTTLLPEQNQQQYNTIVINHYLRMINNPNNH